MFRTTSAGARTLFVFALAIFFYGPAIHAGSVDYFGADAFGNLKVKSFKEQQYRNTSRQMLDHSCGSAALSTLLTYHYRTPTGEADIYQSMWEIGDQEKIRREGFSMLDMKAYLESHGYSADGYETTLEKLSQFGVPGIVLIKDSGYNHFVVVKGVRDRMVSYGDPALGLKVVPIEEFRSKMINRIVFVINGKKDVAVFNHPNDWKIRELAPTHLARGNIDLSQHTLLLRPPGDY